MLRAKELGVHVPALAKRPKLTAREAFFLMAFNDLADGSYKDFSQFCRDYSLSSDERQDLRSVLAQLRRV